MGMKQAPTPVPGLSTVNTYERGFGGASAAQACFTPPETLPIVKSRLPGIPTMGARKVPYGIIGNDAETGVVAHGFKCDHNGCSESFEQEDQLREHGMTAHPRRRR